MKYVRLLRGLNAKCRCWSLQETFEKTLDEWSQRLVAVDDFSF